MSIKITIPNSSSDVLTFGSGNTPTAAQIAGIDSGSSNGQLALYTTASGTSTERVRVDASGNVGVGTVTPGAQLDVSRSSTSGYSTFRLSNSGASGKTYEIGVGGNAAAAGYANNLYFYDSTASAIRMVLDTSGNLLVGTTSTLANERLAVQTSQSASYTQSINNTAASFTGTGARGLLIQYTATPNSTSNAFWDCFDTAGATRRGGLMSNGGLANYSANNTNLSDRREKTDFAAADSYLSKICAIPVQTYKYIDQPDDEKTLGVVAQDVQEIAPELVTETNWGTEEEPKMRLSIYQTDLQYALMKCIQELNARLTALENK